MQDKQSGLIAFWFEPARLPIRRTGGMAARKFPVLAGETNRAEKAPGGSTPIGPAPIFRSVAQQRR